MTHKHSDNHVLGSCFGDGRLCGSSIRWRPLLQTTIRDTREEIHIGPNSSLKNQLGQADFANPKPHVALFITLEPPR